MRTSETSPAPGSSRSILADEEQHIDYLETQLGLIEKLGEPLYLAQLVEQPTDMTPRPTSPDLS